jgi:nitrate reductase cytochrome c-type subunit
MKNLLAVILVLTAATAATAKPSPVEPARSANPIALARASAEFNIGGSSATLERNYFRAPEADPHSGLYLCRFEPSMFAKVRLTQSCK